MGGAASDAVATVIERAPELFLREAAPAQRAAVAVERILRASRLALIPALDRALRDGGLHRRLGRSFLEVTPSQVARLDRLPEGPRCAALGIASLLRSGHVREAAVDGLAPLRGDPLAAALLINRLNDYVGVVADRAWAALEDRLHASLAGVMVQALPLVERMGAWVRAGELRRGRLRAFFLM
ncbi:MAG: hypothetical protein H6710_09395 [Myxococcales bacterium]|nr:hypothetical protein [Myxococcales bacterium]